MILVLGYWALGNIHRYWVVLVLGRYFCHSDTQYNTSQRAVSTVHMPVFDYLVPLVTCTLTTAIICINTMLICCCLLNTIIVIIIEFWDFSWSFLCYTLVSVLIGIGYWYRQKPIALGIRYWVPFLVSFEPYLSHCCAFFTACSLVRPVNLDQLVNYVLQSPADDENEKSKYKLVHVLLESRFLFD